jgi:hypothetical protein
MPVTFSTAIAHNQPLSKNTSWHKLEAIIIAQVAILLCYLSPEPLRLSTLPKQRKERVTELLPSQTEEAYLIGVNVAHVTQIPSSLQLHLFIFTLNGIITSGCSSLIGAGLTVSEISACSRLSRLTVHGLADGKE